MVYELKNYGHRYPIAQILGCISAPKGFNICFSQNSLNGLGLKRDFSENDIKSISEMSNASNRYLLYDIGEKTVEKEVFKNYF